VLTPHENQTMTSVGPGTAMGRALREYWIPALLSSEIEPDGAPLRLKLLGEELLAFRDSDGMPAIVEPFCPHRRAPLFFGRNEDRGLRCVYHGWKFGVSGRCSEMPNEPADSLFLEKIRLPNYRCRDVNGIIWAYMGSRPEPPAIPAIEWARLVEPQRLVTKRVQECNWIQALEGGIDPGHSAFLHSVLPSAAGAKSMRERVFASGTPHFEVIETDYGLRIGMRRDAGGESVFWNITHLLMPFYNAFSLPDGNEFPSIGGFAWVPMDDVSTMVWAFTWNPDRPLTDDEVMETRARQRLGGGVHVLASELESPTSAAGGAWRPRARRENDYLMSRDAQRTQRFSAVPGVSFQDVALQEGMGAICERSAEHLGTSDRAIIQARRCFLRAAAGVERDGALPLGADRPESYRVRGAAAQLQRDEPWTSAGGDWIRGREGARAPFLA
jgi:phthalate 4,5-dioxygenase oxygenase subunit